MKSAFLIACIIVAGICASAEETDFRLLTWDVRVYPEPTPERQDLLSSVLDRHQAEILCIQELPRAYSARTFVEREYVSECAFLDSSDFYDCAVFSVAGFTLGNPPDPVGFLHPPQRATCSIATYDVNIVSLLLLWDEGNLAKRSAERAILAEEVKNMLSESPFLILAGVFHTTGLAGDTIEGLAEDLGMIWVRPLNYDEIATVIQGGRYDDVAAVTPSRGRYDHILVSPAVLDVWEIEARILTFDDDALALQVSDHRPMLADFLARRPG